MASLRVLDFWDEPCPRCGYAAAPLEKPGWTLTFHDEFDIIELQGRLIGDEASSVDLNVHFTKDAHSRPKLPIDASRDFHVWAMEWQEGRVDWYLDGKVVNTYKGPTPREKMSVLMALFQYSGWIGKIDPDMIYAKDFEIDYVRVYSRSAQ